MAQVITAICKKNLADFVLVPPDHMGDKGKGLFSTNFSSRLSDYYHEISNGRSLKTIPGDPRQYQKEVAVEVEREAEVLRSKYL